MKYCSCCKENRPKERFNKNKTRKDGLNSFCRDCQRLKSKEYYSEKREYHKDYVAKQKIATKKLFQEYKNTLRCSKCDFNHPAALDFHHINSSEKEIDISSAVSRNGWSWKRIKKEIDKCVVLCSNCHRIEHYEKIQLGY